MHLQPGESTNRRYQQCAIIRHNPLTH